jgi:tetratricopeptide (TPR) repeat protein
MGGIVETNDVVLRDKPSSGPRSTGDLQASCGRYPKACSGHSSTTTHLLHPRTSDSERGREWALEPLYEDVALLRRAGKFGREEAYEPFDFIVEHAHRSQHQIDPNTFDRIIAEYADPTELARVGLVARARDEHERAVAAWRRGDSCGDAAASVNLGRLLHERGDVRSAEAAWRRADAHGHPDAALLLAFHERGRGNERRAAANYIRGVKRGDRRASVPLGKMYLRQKRYDAAEAAFRRGDLLGDGEAAHQLGHLYSELGQLDAAEAAWSRADERGNAAASFDLAGRLLKKRDLAGAEAALRRAEERGQPVAPFHIGQICRMRGDLRGAENAYRRGDELGDPDATRMLGLVLRERQDFPGAEAAWRRAEDAYNAAGDRKTASAVALDLAVLLTAIDQDNAARAAFQRAVRSPDPGVRWKALDRQDFYARRRHRWWVRLRRRLGIKPRPRFIAGHLLPEGLNIRHE